ncbi:5232_t:CDS:2 [Dentiscutata heterogama]|uniref:5232_t:CDS:1 n=1 Tax=Dentiscutata heterogama TaxID=1316150 RepID=A0ACA9K8G8_9GLOM|nr:5232_t:CDS:2 [Dentiscutata heterogama]
MGRKQHRLTDLFIILDEKANKSNKFAVCKFCIKGSTYEEAYKNRITNTQRECRRHLISCQYFIAEYPSEIMRNKVLNPTLTNKDPQESESESESEQSFGNENNSNKRARLIASDQLGLNITLDGYFQKPLSSKQKEKLEQLLLKATVSCGWAFTWVDNPEIKELFYYINPTIKLPNRQTLSEIYEAKKNFIQTQTAMHATLSNDDHESNNMESEDEIGFIKRQEDISSINDWKEAVNEWNSLIEEEGMEAISEDEEAISELNEEEDAISELNEELAEPDIDNHPAVASSAKWKLETLFDKNNLKHPPYIKLLTE